MGHWLLHDQGGEGIRPCGLNKGEEEVKRILFWSGVWGEMCLQREGEREREVCLTETGKAEKKQFIFMLL